MKKIICSLLIIAMACYAFAAEPGPENIVEEFLRLSKAKEKYEAGMIAGSEMGTGMMEMSSIPEAQRTQIEKMQKKVAAFMLSEMGWDKVKDDFAQVYSEAYTEQEMQESIEILKNPVVQRMIDKEIAMMPEVVKIGQKMAREIMPKMMEFMQAEMAGGGVEEFEGVPAGLMP